MNLEERRKNAEKHMSSGTVRHINKKALKKVLIGGLLLTSGAGLGTITNNLGNSNTLAVTAEKTETEVQNEYRADILFGTNYDVVDQIETNIETFMDHNISKGVYEINTKDQSQVEAMMSEVFDDTYSAYLFANANTIYLNGNNAGKVLKTFGSLPTIMNAQDYIDDLGLYSLKAGLPENLVDLFSSNTDRNFMTTFKNVIDTYEKGNKGQFYQFLEDYENGKYSEVSPFARMLMMNLARNHKSTFADKCWSEKINVGKTENGSIKRLDWWFYDEECSKISTKNDKQISSLNSTCYSEMLSQLDVMNAFLTSTKEEDKYANVKSHDELYNSICKKLSEKYAVGTEANMEAYDVYYKLWKKVIESQKKVGITTTRVYRTGKTHVINSNTVHVSDSELKDNVKPKSDEHKDVTLTDGDNTIITNDVYHNQEYTKDEITQRGYNDALKIVDRYIGGSNIKENLANLKAHRHDYSLTGLDSKYHGTYKKAFDEIMNESINNLQKLVDKQLPEKEEKPNGDEEKELINKKEEDSPETNIENKKDETKKDDDTNNKKEEESKPSTPSKPTDTTNKNDNNNQNTEKNDHKVPDTFIPIGDSTEEVVDGDKVLVDKKEEDSDETILDYNPEKYAKNSSTNEAKSGSKTTSTRSQRLAAYKALRNDTEQVKDVIDQHQNEVGKTK